jgi:hypothetical protein
MFIHFLYHAIVISEEWFVAVTGMWWWHDSSGCKWRVSDVMAAQSVWYRQGGVDCNGQSQWCHSSLAGNAWVVMVF